MDPVMMQAAPAPMMPDQPPQGSTSPATVAPVNRGLIERGRLLIGIAMTALEKGLSMTGSVSPEGKAALKSLTELSKVFGQPAGDLGDAELKMLKETMAPQQGGTGTGPQDMKSQVMQRLGSMGMAPTQ